MQQEIPKNEGLLVEEIIAQFDETANHSGQSMSYKEAMIEPILWFSLAYVQGFPQKYYMSSSTFTHKVNKALLALYHGLAALCIAYTVFGPHQCSKQQSDEYSKLKKYMKEESRNGRELYYKYMGLTMVKVGKGNVRKYEMPAEPCRFGAAAWSPF